MVFKKHKEKVNFFFVDWAELAKQTYPTLYDDAAKNTRIIGRQLAKFIAFIQKKFSADMNSFHCIGHSLGAHVCGFTGKSLQKNHDLIIGKITGLDPGEYTAELSGFVIYRWHLRVLIRIIIRIIILIILIKYEFTQN